MDDNNPYHPTTESTVAEDDSDSGSTEYGIPKRLLAGMVLFPTFVLLTLPFYGIANSSSRAERVETCFFGLLIFAPIFVTIAATSISAFRYKRASAIGRILALLSLAVYAAYGLWLFPMLLRGPIRGF